MSLRLFFILSLSLLLVACSPSAQVTTAAPSRLKSTPPPVPGVSRAHAGATIVYYGECTGLGMALETALAQQFSKDTGIQVKFYGRPPNTTETYALYNRFFQAQSPDLDVLLLDVIWPGAFAEHLLDLGPYFAGSKGQFLPQLVENNTVDGRLVGIPEYLDLGLLYYRTDLLEKYGFPGPPQTWQDLERMARTIQDGERKANPNFYGFVWQGYTSESLTCDALEWQASSGGGNILDPRSGDPTAARPRALEAFRRAAGWIGTISPVGVTSYQEEESRRMFQSGNAAFLRNWPYVFSLAAGEGSAVRGRFGVAALPGDARGGRPAATLGGWQVAISRYSRQPEAAVEFARYWTDPEVQAWRAREGAFLPSIPAVYERPEVRKAQPLCQVVPRVLPYAVARPSRQTGDLYNEVSSIYQQGVSEILQGGDPEFAGARMERDLQGAVDYLRGGGQR